MPDPLRSGHPAVIYLRGNAWITADSSQPDPSSCRYSGRRFGKGTSWPLFDRNLLLVASGIMMSSEVSPLGPHGTIRHRPVNSRRVRLEHDLLLRFEKGHLKVRPTKFVVSSWLLHRPGLIWGGSSFPDRLGRSAQSRDFRPRILWSASPLLLSRYARVGESAGPSAWRWINREVVSGSNSLHGVRFLLGPAAVWSF